MTSLLTSQGTGKPHVAKCSEEKIANEPNREFNTKQPYAVVVSDYSLEQLEIMLAYYINWFNNIRIHSTLGYLSPKEYKLHNLKKVV